MKTPEIMMFLNEIKSVSDEKSVHKSPFNIHSPQVPIIDSLTKQDQENPKSAESVYCPTYVLCKVVASRSVRIL